MIGGVNVKVNVDLMGIIVMSKKYRISYSLIGWNMNGKTVRKHKELSAKDSNSAMSKVLCETKGRAFNFIIQEVEGVDET